MHVCIHTHTHTHTCAESGAVVDLTNDSGVEDEDIVDLTSPMRVYKATRQPFCMCLEIVVPKEMLLSGCTSWLPRQRLRGEPL